MKIRLSLTVLLLTAALLLGACSGSAYRNDLSAADAAGAVSDALPAIGRHAAGDDYISVSAFGSDRDWLLDKTDSHVILLADDSDMNIDEIGVFHVTDPKDVSRVKSILNDYVKAQSMRLKDLLTSYNPGELPKLDEAEVEVCGQYVMYTILSDADTDAAEDAFERLLEQRND